MYPGLQTHWYDKLVSTQTVLGALQGDEAHSLNFCNKINNNYKFELGLQNYKTINFQIITNSQFCPPKPVVHWQVYPP